MKLVPIVAFSVMATSSGDALMNAPSFVRASASCW
jgi:hypothetical protein